MGFSGTGEEYETLLHPLRREYNISNDLYDSLYQYTSLIYSLDLQNRYSKPMPWIGMYIALASIFCVLAMAADLIHGLRNRKLWFPCKYFTLNAASLTVIAVAMKLPVDLNNSMPGDVDQAVKLGSMAFMITIMANFLPSLASMNRKELLTNIIALDILVITLVVNVCIQMKTGVIDERFGYSSIDLGVFTGLVPNIYVATYVAMLLMLLIIQACSALTILKSKQILELKYQAGHKTAFKEQLEMQQPGRLLSVEKLKQHVRNYWIMAETSSPQFTIACSVTTNASGIICSISTAFAFITVLLIYKDYENLHNVFNWRKYFIGSDYKWSTLLILVTQFIGVIVGTIAPLFRCFAALSFKLSIKWIWNHIKVFKVESYWTQKLCDWKQSSIPFSISSRKSKVLFQFFKIMSLNFCIGFQSIVVVACKMIWLIPIFFVICFLLCIRCLKWLKVMFNVPGTFLDNSQHDTSIDLSHYVLQHQDDMEVGERTLKKILTSVNRLIGKAEKKQPSNLMKLLEGSRGFKGVKLFDSHHVPPLLSEEALSSWRLPLVTLTSIAISLPFIKTSRVDSLLRSVSEGLVYVKLVEENLNATAECVSIQKVADMLWLEVEIYHKWLGKKPPKLAPTAGQILRWFKDTAKHMVTAVNSTNYGSPNDNSFYMCNCANSMYRITETILLSYNTNIEEVSHEDLFTKLSSLISDILSACLTNLPQVITMKCHESVIEKREACVHAAAQLLGETTQIINSLQDRELPSLNPDEFPFIDKWRAALMCPSP